MVAYADENMVANEEDIRFVLFGGQDALMKAAQQLGYVQRSKHWEMQYDLKNELHYPLPEGFHFVNSWYLDITKVGECC